MLGVQNLSKAEASHGCDNIYKDFLRYLSVTRDCVSVYRQLIANFIFERGHDEQPRRDAGRRAGDSHKCLIF